MTTEHKPRTSEANGKLWGARARDWAQLQEPTMRPVYERVFDRVSLRAGTGYLEVGCGAGLATAIAGGRGAIVHGLDAAPARPGGRGGRRRAARAGARAVSNARGRPFDLCDVPLSCRTPAAVMPSLPGACRIRRGFPPREPVSAGLTVAPNGV